MKNRATFRAHLKNPRRGTPAHEGAGAYNVTAITHSSDFTIYSPSIPGYYIGTGSKLCTCEICQKARPGSYLSISGQLRSTMALKILLASRSSPSSLSSLPPSPAPTGHQSSWPKHKRFERSSRLAAACKSGCQVSFKQKKKAKGA